MWQRLGPRPEPRLPNSPAASALTPRLSYPYTASSYHFPDAQPVLLWFLTWYAGIGVWLSLGFWASWIEYIDFP